MEARLLIAPSEDVLRAVLLEDLSGLQQAGPFVSYLDAGAGSILRSTISQVPDPRTHAVLQFVSANPPEVDAVIVSILPDLRDGRISPDQTEHHLVEIARLLDQGCEAHLFVLNCSSFDPEDEAFTYAGRDEEPLPLRAHRFNIAVIRAALRSSLSVIDVDNLVAEAGGAEHVEAPFRYSDLLWDLIRHELARSLKERLAMSRGNGIFSLVVPRYDRRVSEVVVTRWHKRPGEWITYGEPLLEVRADNVGWRIETAGNGKPRSTGRSLGLVVNAGREGVLRQTVVGEGSTVRVGERIGIVTAGPEVGLQPSDGEESTPSFPATASPLALQGEAVVT
jgi:hypothetical protein